MADLVNIHQAKTHFSSLIARVEKGEEIVIARAGEAVARLLPVEKRKPRPKPGLGKGTVTIADDFDAPLPDDVLDGFYEKPVFPTPRK